MIKQFSLTLAILLFFSSCSKNDSKFVVNPNTKKIFTKNEAKVLESAVKKLFSPSETNKQNHWLLNKIATLQEISIKNRRDGLSKGDKIEIESINEELKIVQKDRKLDTRLVKQINKLSDRLLKGKEKNIELPDDIRFPKTPFVNKFETPAYKGQTQVPLDLQRKTSIFNSTKAYLLSRDDKFNCTGITYADPDPFGDALTANDYTTKRTQEILDLAANLDDANDIFRYVRDQIEFYPAFGVTQSAHQTGISRLGTFIDKANFLVSLLRAKGIAAQFIFGDVLVDEDKLKGIFGVEGKFDLYFALSNSLDEYWNRPGKGTIFFKNGKRTWLIPHAWVRAYVDGEWVELDPSNITFEYGSSSPIFRRFDISIDFEKYLIGQNERGQYEKPGNLLDFVLESLGGQIRSNFGTGFSVSDLDLRKYGQVITPETPGLPVGTMSYNGTGCPYQQENLVPDSFQLKASLKLEKDSNVVFDETWNVNEFAEKGVYTQHSAGLLGRVGDVDGQLNIYIGNEFVDSFSARTTDQLKIIQKMQYYPTAYVADPRLLGDDTRFIESAGDVYSFMSYSAPRVTQNLREAVAELKLLINQNASEQRVYAQFLRAADNLVIIKEFESQNLNKIINTFGGNLRGTFWTFGKGGIIKDRDDRPYGSIPLGTAISWTGGGSEYSRSGNFTNFTNYTNLTNANLAFILNGSQIEANVWEILFGVPGGASTKLYQLMAIDTFVDGKENILVTNQQLGVGNEAEILGKFESDMVDIVANSAFDPDKRYIEFKSVLYSHKRIYNRDNGFQGLSVLVLPTDPRSGSLALYSGITPNRGINSPFGGGTTGDEVDGKEGPDDQDVDDSEYKGGESSCNPVSYSTGTMFHDFVDFSIKDRTPLTTLKFTRKYTTKPFKPLNDLGPDWSHNFQTRLISEGFDILMPAAQTNVIWIKEGGNKVVFTRNSDGTFSGPSSVQDELIEEVDHFKVKRKGGMFWAFAKNSSPIIDGRMLYFEEPHGERISLTYNLSGRLETAHAPFAGSITFGYDSSDRITTIHRERDNLTYSYAYNTDGRLMSSSDFDNNTTTYDYVTDRPGTDAQDLLKTITNPIGAVIAFEYYDDGRVFKEIGRGGAKTSYFYSYFLVDQLTRVRGANGATRKYKFDDKFRLIETEYEDSSRIKKIYDDDSNVIAKIDELGYKTEFTFDSRGNQTGIKMPEHSGFITTEYHPIYERPTKVTPLLGAIIQNTFNELNGDLTKSEKIDTQGSIPLIFTHDSFGNVLSTNNGEVTYTDVRDTNGFLITKFDSRNPSTITYDSRGRISSITSEAGNIITLEYDNHDRVIRKNNSHGPDEINVYDAIGRLTSKTLTDGVTSQTTLIEYDNRNRQIAVTDPLGRRSENKYDIPGLGCKYVIDQPVETRDAAGRITKFSFNSRNRLVRKVEHDGTVTRSEFNNRGDLIAVTDGSGNRTNFKYDGNRRVIRRERAGMKSSPNGTATAATETTIFKYDEADRLVREEKLLPGESNGTEIAKLVTENTYNDLGQKVGVVIKKEFMGTTETLDSSTFSFKRLLDSPSLTAADNQHAKLEFVNENAPPFALTSYKVNATDVNNPLELIEGDFTIIPDSVAPIKSLSLNGNELALFENTHDPVGRLTKKVSRYLGNKLTTDITFDNFGRKDNVNHSNGLNGIHTYDLLNRLTNLTWTGAGENFSESLTYESLTGNITNIARELGSFAYNYDQRNQLTGVTYSGTEGLGPLVDRTLTYDRSGNRTNDTFSGVGTFTRNTIEEDENFRYFTDVNGFGNIIQKTNKATGELHIYDYLHDGKIRKFTKYENIPRQTETLSVSYFYDALGRRIAKKVKKGTQEFTQSFAYLTNQNKILLSKKGDGNTTLHIDGQGIDEHLGEITGSGVKAFVTDHLGTVINGDAVGEKRTTGAFGEPLTEVDKISTSQPAVLYGYAGRQLDSESGLYYNRARYYDSSNGRWMSKDPIGISGGDPNLYRYVGNNSLSNIDPTGTNLKNFLGGLIKTVGPVGFAVGVGVALSAAVLKDDKELLNKVINFVVDEAFPSAGSADELTLINVDRQLDEAINSNPCIF